MKIGRNDPCPCGSGRKYKKCCDSVPRGHPTGIMSKARTLLGLARFRGEPPEPLIFQGSPVIILGNSLVYTDPGRTFHELLRTLTAKTLGEEWVRTEIAKPESECHPIARWFHAVSRLTADQSRATKHPDGQFSVPADGDSLRLLLFGRDLWYLRHGKALPTKLLSRLRHRENFQGALYEIAVASIVARAGFSIDWIDETSAAQRPEFIASSTSSSVRIAVEAKSRHRPGSLGQLGTSAAPGDIKLDLDALGQDAISKDSQGLPFLIFVDLNSPHELSPASREVVRDLQALGMRLSTSGGKPGAGFNALILTNIAYHYGAPLEVPPRPWFGIYRSRYATSPLPAGVLDEIFSATRFYGQLPDPDGPRV